VDIRGYPPMSFEGRDELVRWIMGARQNWSWLKVEFLDVNVTINADGQTAVANFTGKATVPSDRDFFVQEFNFLLKKVDGKWLIYRIESVKTLSLLEHSSPAWSEWSIEVVEYWSIEQCARPSRHYSITPFRRTA
jgi:hypothetical protein